MREDLANRQMDGIGKVSCALYTRLVKVNDMCNLVPEMPEYGEEHEAYFEKGEQ